MPAGVSDNATVNCNLFTQGVIQYDPAASNVDDGHFVIVRQNTPGRQVAEAFLNAFFAAETPAINP